MFSFISCRFCSLKTPILNACITSLTSVREINIKIMLNVWIIIYLLCTKHGFLSVFNMTYEMFELKYPVQWILTINLRKCFSFIENLWHLLIPCWNSLDNFCDFFMNLEFFLGQFSNLYKLSCSVWNNTITNQLITLFCIVILIYKNSYCKYPYTLPPLYSRTVWPFSFI